MQRRFALQVAGSTAVVSLAVVAGHVWAQMPGTGQAVAHDAAPIRMGLEPLPTRLDLLFRENTTDKKASPAGEDHFPDQVQAVEVIRAAAPRPAPQVVQALPAAPAEPIASQAPITARQPENEPVVVGDHPDARPIRQIAHWGPADIGEMPSIDPPAAALPVAPPAVAAQPASVASWPVVPSPAAAPVANQPATVWANGGGSLQPATNVALQPINAPADLPTAEVQSASGSDVPANMLRRGTTMVAERIATEGSNAPAANTSASIDQAQMQQALEAPPATSPTPPPVALPAARYETPAASPAAMWNEATANPLRRRSSSQAASPAVNPLRASH